jgi:hypothetical protein
MFYLCNNLHLLTTTDLFRFLSNLSISHCLVKVKLEFLQAELDLIQLKFVVLRQEWVSAQLGETKNQIQEFLIMKQEQALTLSIAPQHRPHQHNFDLPQPFSEVTIEKVL